MAHDRARTTSYLGFAMENTGLSLTVVAAVLLVLDTALVGAAIGRFQRFSPDPGLTGRPAPS